MCTMCHREPRGAPGVLCRGQDHHVTRGLTRVGACWTVQGHRMSSFGSRRRRFSGNSSMCLASLAPRPVRDTDTPWQPWAATTSYSEDRQTRAQVRRDAALAGHRLSACQISRRQLLRALLLCGRGHMVSSGGGGTRVVFGGDTRVGTAALSWHRESQRAH